MDNIYEIKQIVKVRVSADSESDAKRLAGNSLLYWHDWDVVEVLEVKELHSNGDS